MGKVTLIATAAMGIEALVAREVRDLGYECQVENSKVTFEADEKGDLSHEFMVTHCGPCKN